MSDRIMRAKQLTLSGEDFDNAAAGTTADISIYLKDKSGKILLADGLDVPVDATSGYAKGCLFIDRNVATGVSGLYENVGTSTSCNFDSTTATVDELNLLDGLTATTVELNAAADQSSVVGLMTPGAIIGAALADYDVTVFRTGNIIKTTMFIDLQGAKSATGNLDIIGNTGATNTIGRVTTAINGVIFAGQVSCAEVPTTGDDDIDLYAATAADGAYDAAVTGVAGAAALMTAGGAHAIGTVKPFTALPAADAYLYLVTGDTTAGTYAAGKLIIEMWGLAS